MQKGQFLEEWGAEGRQLLLTSEFTDLDKTLLIPFHERYSTKQTGLYVVLINNWYFEIEREIPASLAISSLSLTELAQYIATSEARQLEDIRQQMGQVPNEIIDQLKKNGYVLEQYIYVYAHLTAYLTSQNQRSFTYSKYSSYHVDKAHSLLEKTKTTQELVKELPGSHQAYKRIKSSLTSFIGSYDAYTLALTKRSCPECPDVNDVRSEVFDLFEDSQQRLWLLVADPQDGIDGKRTSWVQLGKPKASQEKNAQWYNSKEGVEQGIDLKGMLCKYLAVSLEAEFYWQKTLFGGVSDEQTELLANRLLRRAQWDVIYTLQQEWVNTQVGSVQCWIPIWESAKSAYFQYQVGNANLASLNGVVAATDVYWVTSMLRNISLRSALQATGKALQGAASRQLTLSVATRAFLGSIRNVAVNNLLNRLRFGIANTTANQSLKVAFKSAGKSILTYSLSLTMSMGQIPLKGLQLLAKEGVQSSVLLIEQKAMLPALTNTALEQEIKSSGRIVASMDNVLVKPVTDVSNTVLTQASSLVAAEAASQAGKFTITQVSLQGVTCFVLSFVNHLQQVQHLQVLNQQGETTFLQSAKKPLLLPYFCAFQVLLGRLAEMLFEGFPKVS